ncbi:MAG: hypothetical protein Q8P05_05165 [Candidatus Diapherotrites archaeon]|nr:hypothetical protein [Candidatus Diapherotrites archaeon]MDZ4256778.1 hypothetical protein [archaeon]
MPSLRQSGFRIVIRRVEPPFERDPEQEMEWICQSLGFLPLRGDRTAIDIFKRVVKATEEGNGISSTQLAIALSLSRGAVINQLNNLLRSGLVVKEGHKYFARSRSMVRTLREVEEDVKRIFDTMEAYAREIDKEFGVWENDFPGR